MRELFGSSIKKHHADKLRYYINNCDSEVFSLNFEKVTVIDVTFFTELKSVLGEDYDKIKFVKLSPVFRRHVC